MKRIRPIKSVWPLLQLQWRVPFAACNWRSKIMDGIWFSISLWKLVKKKEKKKENKEKLVRSCVSPYLLCWIQSEPMHIGHPNRHCRDWISTSFNHHRPVFSFLPFVKTFIANLLNSTWLINRFSTIYANPFSYNN